MCRLCTLVPSKIKSDCLEELATRTAYGLLEWHGEWNPELPKDVVNWNNSISLMTWHRHRQSIRLLIRRAKNWDVGDFKHDIITYFTLQKLICIHLEYVSLCPSKEIMWLCVDLTSCLPGDAKWEKQNSQTRSCPIIIQSPPLFIISCHTPVHRVCPKMFGICACILS